MQFKGKSSGGIGATLLVLILAAVIFFFMDWEEPVAVDPAFSEQPEQYIPGSTLPHGHAAVHFIDVGQGDATLIQTAEQFILVDGGTRSAGQRVVNYLNNLGVDHIAIVVGTHPHEDHIGGLMAVFDNFSVGEVIDPGVIHTSKTFEQYLELIDEKNIPFTEGRSGISRDLGGGVEMLVVHPTSPSSSHLNNASVVVRITCGSVAFILTGDAEAEAEQEMLESGRLLESNVLKVGHHGSRTSTTTEFLNAVNPAVAVISFGENNSYGHPHPETMEMLARHGYAVYGTAVHGTVYIVTDGDNISVYHVPEYFLE